MMKLIKDAKKYTTEEMSGTKLKNFIKMGAKKLDMLVMNFTEKLPLFHFCSH